MRLYLSDQMCFFSLFSRKRKSVLVHGSVWCKWEHYQKLNLCKKRFTLYRVWGPALASGHTTSFLGDATSWPQHHLHPMVIPCLGSEKGCCVPGQRDRVRAIEQVSSAHRCTFSYSSPLMDQEGKKPALSSIWQGAEPHQPFFSCSTKIAICWRWLCAILDLGCV